MDSIKLYTVDPRYIDYLCVHCPHLFHNKKPTQANERKYIGIVLRVEDMNYFAPLSSFKDKHRHMKEGLDLLKIKDYAVINLNNMFPAQLVSCHYVDIAKVHNQKYKDLLLAEWRYIKSIQQKIRNNACTLYQLKIQAIKDSRDTPLTKRCADFLLLESLCHVYKTKA